MKKQKCNFCSFPSLKKVISIPDFNAESKKIYSLFKCSVCGLYQQSPIPSAKEIEQFYPKEYPGNFIDPTISKETDLVSLLKKSVYAFSDKFLSKFDAELEFFESYKIKNKINKPKILDIGCGAGHLLKSLNHKNYDLHGIDIDLDVVENLKKFNIKTYHGFFEDFKSEEKFHIIYMSHVLEHVSDVKATLEKVKSHLYENGIVYIKVPNIDSLTYILFRKYARLLDLPRHIFMFSPRTLTNFLEASDFKDIVCTTFPGLMLLDSILNMLGLGQMVRKNCSNNFFFRLFFFLINHVLTLTLRFLLTPIHLILQDTGDEIHLKAYLKKT